MPRPARALKRGPYRLLECLGRGGMAEVWRAQSEGPSGFVRTLAVKRILPHLLEHPGVVELFKREATSSALLHHRNVVQVFELVEAGGEYLLAMELVEGSDLATLLAAGPLPLGFTVAVGLAIARALAYAHTLRGSDGPLLLVHRDVSPSNVLVGLDGAIKLSDFGIAKVQAHVSAVTQSKVRGKTAYMSPEQGAGERIDARSDLFSLGVTLYEALTGARPFDALMGALTLRAGAVVAPPRATNPEIPPELEAVVLRLLAHDPEARFATADEVVAALDAIARAHWWTDGDTARLVAERRRRPAPSSATGATPATATATKRRGPLLLLVAAAVMAALVVLGIVIARTFRSPAPPAPPASQVVPTVPSPPPPPTPPPPTTPAVAPPAPPERPRPISVKRPRPKKAPREDLRKVEVRDPFAD